MIARTPVSLLMPTAGAAQQPSRRNWSRFAAVATLAMIAFAAVALPARPALAESVEAHWQTLAPADGRTPLLLDTTRLAVFGLNREANPGGDQVAVPQQLARHGLAPEFAQPWPVRGWSLLPVTDGWADQPAPAPSTAGHHPGTAAPDARDRLPFEARVAAVARDLAPTGAFVSPVFASAEGDLVFMSPDVLVSLNRQAGARAAEVLRHALTMCGPDASVDEPWQQVLPDVYRLRTDLASGFDVLRLARYLGSLPGVTVAEPDSIMTVRRNLTPDDPDFDESWGLHNIGQTGGVDDADIDAVEAWDTTTGSPDVVIAVIDDGIQRDHPDIRQVAGVDLTSDNGDGGPVNDYDNHGTAVAGIITARLNNSLGSVGVAPTCFSVSVRTFISINETRVTSQLSWTVEALIFAWGSGAQVTNNSYEYPITAATIGMAYDATRELGVMHFASAGNDGLPQIAYPARLPSVNAVGAFNASGERSVFSNYGDDLFALAPGEAIFTTDRTDRPGYSSGDFAVVSGTSFASAFASGVAALAYSQRPSITTDELQLVLERSCVDQGVPGFDTETGYGWMNADRAVSGPTEILKIRTPDGAPDDEFGKSVDVSGDAIIVGAHLDTEGAPRSGAAFVYRFDRQTQQWSQEAKLLPSTPTIGAYFGWSVAIDGDLAVVGAPFDSFSATNSGAIYVFRYDENTRTWAEEARLLGSTTNQFDAFGFSVDIRNGVIAAGGYLDDDLGQNAGIAYAFEYDPGQAAWQQTARFFALDGGAEDWFGFSVGVDPVTGKVAVGAPRHQSHRGAVYIYAKQTNGTWRQEAKLMSSDNAAFDWFGQSVAMNNDFILIGAPQDDDRGTDSGSVYAFQYQPGSGRWIEVQKLLATEGGVNTHFGHAVRMTPVSAVISSIYDRDYGNEAGAAYVFRLDGVNLVWNEDFKLYSSDLAPGDQLGSSVAIDGARVVLGAPGDDDRGSNAGAAYLFELDELSPRFRLFISPDILKYGQEGRFVVQGAQPFTATYLVFSDTGIGSTFVRRINNTVDLDRAQVIFGARETNEVGFVQWIQDLPPGAGGRPIWFQAAQESALSNVIETVIEDP